MHFAVNKKLKILRTNTLLNDIIDKEVLLQEIESSNHRGITEIIKELKSKIYHPDLGK